MPQQTRTRSADSDQDKPDYRFEAPGNLLLDAENPRLASAFPPGHKPTQNELVEVLWKEEAVDEVAISIAENGYYPEERLLAIKAGTSNSGSFVVIEGNRRLAAVLLLLDDRLRKRVGATDLPRLGQRRLRELDSIPIAVYASRRDLWSYLGFRHINGTKPWDAHSKAQYIANVHDKFGIDLDEIASRIGDRNSTVTRLYRGLKVLEQAESQTSFDVDDRVKNKFYFSHLYTATDQPAYQSFLSITPENSLRANPVPKAKLSELAELMVWLYGKKSANKQPIVQTQNPDLNTLREVISSKPGLSALRAGYPLATAHDMSIGDPRRFREALTRASEELRRAKGTVVGGYKGEADLRELMETISALTESISKDMDEVTTRPRTRN